MKDLIIKFKVISKDKFWYFIDSHFNSFLANQFLFLFYYSIIFDILFLLKMQANVGENVLKFFKNRIFLLFDLIILLIPLAQLCLHFGLWNYKLYIV